MEPGIINKLENKIIFNVSRYFWHFIIALISLGTICSICFFIWCIIPPVKSTPDKQSPPAKPTYPVKPAYPTLVKVSLDEIMPKIQHKPLVNETKITEEKKEIQKVKEIKKDTVLKEVKKQPVKTEDPAEKEYNASLEKLKQLIPDKKNWEADGYYIYPQGERYWTVYKQEKYRVWVATGDNLDSKLIKTYKNTEAKNYTDYKAILDSYNNILGFIAVNKRMSLLNLLMAYTKETVTKTKDLHSLLTQTLKIFPQEETDFIGKLCNFYFSNPNDGKPFLEYLNKVIPQFANSERLKVVDALLKAYYDYYDNSLHRQIEATDLFLTMINQIKPDDQIPFLKKYYEVYLNKNIERERKIMSIDDEYKATVNKIDFEHSKAIQETEKQYQEGLRNAERDYYEKQITKDSYRMKGLFGILIGLVLISLFAIILVFLSMQRSLKKIEEKLTKNQN